MKFLNEDLGFITKTDEIYKTNNGGITWSKVYDCTNLGLLNAIHIVDDIDVYVVGYGIILKSSDFGNIWIEYSDLPMNRFLSVYFTDLQNGFVGGEDGLLYMTNDGGNSWEIASSSTSMDIQDIIFVDPIRGYYISSFLGGMSKVFETNNGGETWELFTQTESTARKMILSPSYDIYIPGNAGLLDKITRPPIPTLPGYIIGSKNVLIDTPYHYSLYQQPEISYSWEISNNPNFTITSNGIQVIWSSYGNDTISVTPSNPCDNGPARKIVVQVTDTAYRINKINDNLINRLYPNPVNSSLSIEVNHENYDKISISIYKINGQLISELSRANFINDKTITIDVSDFSPGVYLLKYEIQSTRNIVRFIKL
jgi:hypothetical protein